MCIVVKKQLLKGKVVGYSLLYKDTIIGSDKYLQEGNLLNIKGTIAAHHALIHIDGEYITLRRIGNNLVYVNQQKMGWFKISASVA